MEQRDLKNLARLYGVNSTYIDVWGQPRTVSADALLRMLQLLGAEVASLDDVPQAMRQRRQSLWQEMIEPVSVAWEATPTTVALRLRQSQSGSNYRCRLEFENGGHRGFAGRIADLPARRRSEVEGVEYVSRLLKLPPDLPHGYHRLWLEIGGQRAETLLISAPRQAYAETPTERGHLWGVFLPLYSLYRESNWGAGDFSNLESLMQWTSEQGGNLVATLPLLASLWELSDDPSPYNPASRLFWNEFYLDPRQLPELDFCPAAQAALSKADEQVAQGSPRSNLVDYASEMRFKRQVLESVAAAFFQHASLRRDALTQHCQTNPELEAFARFRAVGERQGRGWPDWPEPLRRGKITPADYDERVYRYHLYTQWQVDQQLASMTSHANRMNLLWYLDFPLGVSGNGYDVWREPEIFVREASGGAPPDTYFTKGQDWGFPPLHPEKLRRQGYRYFIEALRTHLAHARVLRFDHVMSLYRFYWVPHGFAPSDGAYVRYRMEELFAILTLESHRYRARIVGENLGTVPKVVDQAMAQHGVDEMYVLQYETNPDKGPALRPVPATSVASVNTHDMPQFASYWQGLDIEDRVRLGLFTDDEADQERVRRNNLREDLVDYLRQEKLLAAESPQTLDALEACMAFLARSPASLVLVNLEDLWGETQPQNRPGTFQDYPNWRRKAQYSFEEFRKMPVVKRVLATVNRLRREADAHVSNERRGK